MAAALGFVDSNGGKSKSKPFCDKDSNIKEHWTPLKPVQHGKIGFFIENLAKVLLHNIDRPQYQCRSLNKLKKTFNGLNKARKVCVGRKKAWEKRSKKKADNEKERNDKEEARALKQSAKAEKQAAKDEEQNRRRRDTDESDDIDQNEIVDETDVHDSKAVTDLQEMAQLMQDIEDGDKEIDQTILESVLDSDCVDRESLSAEDNEQCDYMEDFFHNYDPSIASRKDKERAEIILRISKMFNGLKKWTDGYIPTFNHKINNSIYKCSRANLFKDKLNRMKRRMHKKRREFATNKKKNDREKKQEKENTEE